MIVAVVVELNKHVSKCNVGSDYSMKLFCILLAIILIRRSWIKEIFIMHQTNNASTRTTAVALVKRFLTKHNQRNRNMNVSFENDVELGGAVEVFPRAETTIEDTVGEENGRKPLGAIKENTPIEIAAGALALISVSTSVATMIVFGGMFLNIAGILSILLGPYSYWQQRNITDVKALKETHEALTKEVDILQIENTRLKRLVDDLGGAVDKLEDVENTFDYINDMNVESVEEFRKQVEESKNILNIMRRNVKSSAMQNVITVVTNSDADGNYVFDKDEVEGLILNLKAINGLEFHEQNFRDCISDHNGNVDAVIKVLNHVMFDDGKSNKCIFKFKDNGIE